MFLDTRITQKPKQKTKKAWTRTGTRMKQMLMNCSKWLKQKRMQIFSSRSELLLFPTSRMYFIDSKAGIACAVSSLIIKLRSISA